MEPALLDPDQTTATGRLLHFASQGDVEAVEKVLDDLPKVPVDSQDYDGRTAMHLAASEGHRGVIELLLKRRANVNPVDRWRKTPLADARRYEAVNAKISRKRQIYQEVCNLLVRHGGSTSSPFEIDKDELTYIQEIRKSHFGEIKLANWRGTNVQARIMNRQEEQDSPKSDGPNLTKQLSLLQRLRHPNIVQFLGAVQARKEALVLVTEFLPKGSLCDLLRESKKGRIPQKEAMNYALDIARGMNYLHQHKPEEVVHCDLNPMNLLRDDGGHLKVAGLHLSEIESICKYGNHIFRDQEPTYSRNLSQLDGEEVMNVFKIFLRQQMLEAHMNAWSSRWPHECVYVSTAWYRAPELTSTNPKTPAGSADVYSFGVIVKQMFEGRSLASRQAQKAGAKEAAKQDAAAARLYPPGMLKILQTCCDLDPKKRPRFEQIIGNLETINTAMMKKTCLFITVGDTISLMRRQLCIPHEERPPRHSSVFSVESQKGTKVNSTGADGHITYHVTILE